MPDNASESTKTVVTLVHGTFARDADWMQADSQLCQSLRKTFGVGLVLEPFNWSGGNNHCARTTAAVELREHLSRCPIEHPGARHFVIGHSHGGNVIMYDLCDDTLRNRVSGSVCLSTPFLHVRFVPVDTFPVLAAFWCITVSVWMLLSIGLGELLGIGLLGLILTGAALAVLLAIAFFAVLIGVERIVHTVGVPLSGNRWDFETMAANRLRLAKLEPDALLLLRPTGDEASMALSSAQFMRWLVRQICSFVGYLAFGLGRLLARLIMKPNASFEAGLLFVYLLHKTIMGLAVCFVFFPGARLVIGVALALAFVPIVLGAVLTVILLVGMALCHLGIGYDAMLWSPALETTVESTPLGEWKVTHIDMPKGKLAHSELYENEQALEEMTKWLLERQKAN